VGKNLFLRDDYVDSIPKIVKETELLDRLRYRYSDLPYYILKKYIEEHYDKPLNDLIQDHFYRSLGANNTLYNPYNKLSNKNIVPTEHMQMFLQKGFYGGKRFLKSETISKFNTCYFCDRKNRRGIGFDKPQLGDSGPTCGCVSMTSFGHSGFTGTYAWADPDEELVYIFLANRTYPSSKGKNTLLRENIRTNIQQAIYDAIIN